MLVKIPFEYLNNVQNENCATDFLLIDNSNFEFCGDKYFTLRLKSISTVGSATLSTFEFNGDLYGVTSLSPTQLIELLATVFTCPPSYGCLGQEASFNWSLRPLTGERWISETILNNVSSVNSVYSFANIQVNSVTYNPLPHVFWTNTTDGNASQNPYDYNEAIIAYIVSLDIPEYIGAINHATNDMDDNLQGSGLLELYFTTGSSVTITITAPSPVVSGTFVEYTDSGGTSLFTYMLLLDVDNTSTQSSGDILTGCYYEASDGINMVGSTTTPDATLIVYSIFCGGCGLDTSGAVAWIINLTIISQATCARNNLATGFVSTAQIQSALDGNTINGNSIA